MGRVNFGAKKSHRHSERSEESPGRKRRRRGLRCEERNWGEKWQNGEYRYALSDNSTVNRILFLPLIHRKRSPFPPGGRQEKREVSGPPVGEGKRKRLLASKEGKIKNICPAKNGGFSTTVFFHFIRERNPAYHVRIF